MYNGHSYCCYTSTNLYPFYVQTASPGAVEYGPGTKYKNVIFGDDYIRQHINALATEKLNITSTYIYGGSVMIVDAGLNGSVNVKNFFPKVPVTVLTRVIKTATVQGVLTEIVGLLTVLIPFTILCIGLRKGLQFTLQILRTA